VAKITGKEGETVSGTAAVFDCEEDMLAALDRKEIKVPFPTGMDPLALHCCSVSETRGQLRRCAVCPASLLRGPGWCMPVEHLRGCMTLLPLLGRLAW
jgi:hypothetical protein